MYIGATPSPLAYHPIPVTRYNFTHTLPRHRSILLSIYVISSTIIASSLRSSALTPWGCYLHATPHPLLRTILSAPTWDPHPSHLLPCPHLTSSPIPFSLLRSCRLSTPSMPSHHLFIVQHTYVRSLAYPVLSCLLLSDHSVVFPALMMDPLVSAPLLCSHRLFRSEQI